MVRQHANDDEDQRNLFKPMKTLEVIKSNLSLIVKFFKTVWFRMATVFEVLWKIRVETDNISWNYIY